MAQARPAASMEPLESRRLMSAAFLHAGVLHVNADAGAANTVTVDRGTDAAGMPGIAVTVTSVSRRGVTRDFAAFFPDAVPVASVLVRGGAKADAINVNQADPSAAFPPTRVLALGGDDVVRTGSEADVVRGGPGDDTLAAGDGANRVFGEAGDDAITAGSGADRIDGGAGNDVVHAGGGDDLVRGGKGDDQLFGEAGMDTLFGERGTDLLDGGDDADVLWGGRDDDTEVGGAGDDQLGGVVGMNVLTGGAGRDTFVVVSLEQQAGTDYSTADPAGTGADVDVLKLVTKKADDGNAPPAA